MNGKDVRGLLRLHTREAADKLIAASGHFDPDTGQHWFCEAVSHNLQDNEVRLAWIPWQQPESWHDYAERCRRQKGSKGLVHGRHQMALRVAQGDPRIVVKPSIWRIEVIPQGWSPQQVEDFCSQAGLSEIELVSKNWRRNGSTWLVRAMASHNEDTMSIAVAMDDSSDREVAFSQAQTTE